MAHTIDGVEPAADMEIARRAPFCRGLLVALLAVMISPATPAANANAAAAFTCPRTVSNSTIYGNAYLSVIVGWLDGVLRFKEGFGTRYADGARGVKVAWDRKVHGQLSITGRRLDGPAPPLRAEVLEGYGDIGGQTTAVIFPTDGCWEVTGTVAGHSLTVVWEVHLSDAPARSPEGAAGNRE